MISLLPPDADINVIVSQTDGVENEKIFCLDVYPGKIRAMLIMQRESVAKTADKAYVSP